MQKTLQVASLMQMCPVICPSPRKALYLDCGPGSMLATSYSPVALTLTGVLTLAPWVRKLKLKQVK